METLSTAMEQLVGQIEAATHDRRVRLHALRAHTLAALSRFQRERQAAAREISEAKRLWSTVSRAPHWPPPAPVPHAAKSEAESPPLTQKQQVLAIIQAHPDGVRLVDIGNELGVDWRSLISVVKTLLDEQVIGKIDSRYYPMQE